MCSCKCKHTYVETRDSLKCGASPFLPCLKQSVFFAVATPDHLALELPGTLLFLPLSTLPCPAHLDSGDPNSSTHACTANPQNHLASQNLMYYFYFSQNNTLNFLLLLCMHDIWVCMPWHIYGSQRVIFGSQFSPSTFMWVLGIRSPGLHAKCFYPLSHLAGPKEKKN